MLRKISESPTGSQDSEMSLNNLPTEIFFVLCEYLAPKDLIRFRQVCTLWRDVIDAFLHDDSKWESFCKHDFPNIYEEAMWKTPDIMSWFEMYRSLSLWAWLYKSQENVDEFCHSDTINEEMRSIAVQKKGLIMVHKRCRIVYHDLLSLGVAKRRGFPGQFVSFVELKDYVVVLKINGDLCIISKPEQNWHSNLLIETNRDDVVFSNVKTFIVDKRTVFFSRLRPSLYTFNLDQRISTRITLPESMLEQYMPDYYSIAALGYNNGYFKILTMGHNMYTCEDTNINLEYKLNRFSNVMDCLYQQNMLENLDWRNYYILMASLKQKRHTGLLQFISKIHVYGDKLFLVGTRSGVLNIYYNPFIDGHLNLTEFAPVKSYNFSARIDIPILSVYPIINLQVVETKEGHVVLVCMPRKILVITYSNDFRQTKSLCTAVIPYVPPVSIP